MAKVKKRGDSWEVSYRDPNGKWKRVSKKHWTRSDAETELAKRQVDIGNGLYQEPQKVTLSAMLERFTAKYGGQPSFIVQMTFLEAFKAFMGKDRLLTSIRYQHLDDYYNHLKTTVNRKGTLYRGTTLNRHMGTINKMFRYAVNLGYIVKSPLEGRAKDFRSQESEGNYRYLTKEEIVNLLKSCDHDRDLQRRIAFSLNTGMDHEDIQRLTWSMTENDQIHTYRSKLVRDDNKKWLIIPINAEVTAILRAIKREEGIKDKTATIFRRRSIFIRFNAVVKKAKLFSPDHKKNVTFKTLRHTFASHLAMRGRHPKEIAELMGHNDLNMTMRYMHLSPKQKTDAVKCLEGLTKHCTNITQKTLGTASIQGS